MKTLARLIAIVVVLTFAGCATVAPNYNPSPASAQRLQEAKVQTANGSGRVLQSRASFVCDGSAPVFHVRAERSLIPAASAAASMVFASISFFLSRLTCASVTIELLGAPAPVRSPQLRSFSRAVSTTSNRQK